MSPTNKAAWIQSRKTLVDSSEALMSQFCWFVSYLFLQRYCNFLDGNLASLQSKEEYDFIRDVIFKATGKNTRTWLGGNDAVKVRVVRN